jgi:ubiquinone/menaquinone biosynthesis C-methylase UbiE
VDRDHVAMVAARFSQDAPLYERFWAASLAALGRRLLAGLPTDNASVVVDIGAGVGALLPAIREAAPRAFVAGVDAAEGMIRRAPRDFGRAVMDAGRLALRDESIDGAVMPFMLFFLSDPRRGLEETRRVLRPGGWLGVTTWAAGLIDYRADEIWADLLDEYGAPPHEATPAVDLMDTPEKLVRLLKDAGFQDIRTETEAEPVSMTVEQFLEVRGRIGRSKRRLQSLAPHVRTDLLSEARKRLAKLRPEDFTDPQVALLAWASKPR